MKHAITHCGWWRAIRPSRNQPGNALYGLKSPATISKPWEFRWFADIFFDDRDQPNQPPVAIINETSARRYWPGEDPIGKHLKGFDPRGHNDDWLTVVGVVKDTRTGLEKAPFSQIYEVQAQRVGERINDLVIRTAGNPADLANSVRGVIRTVNHNAAVASITTMELLLDRQRPERRFQTWIISTFSGTALGLATLGIFATMHYSVAARINEIGIRMAIGANSSDITRLVLGNSTRLAVAGIAVGVLAALWSTEAISGMLYNVKPDDPWSFGGAAAYRASHIDPMSALHEQ